MFNFISFVLNDLNLIFRYNIIDNPIKSPLTIRPTTPCPNDTPPPQGILECMRNLKSFSSTLFLITFATISLYPTPPLKPITSIFFAPLRKIVLKFLFFIYFPLFKSRIRMTNHIPLNSKTILVKHN